MEEKNEKIIQLGCEAIYNEWLEGDSIGVANDNIVR